MTNKAIQKADETQALAVLSTVAANRQQVQEFLDDGGLVFNDLPQIKVPAAGGKFWEMPDGTPSAEFRAIVLMQQLTRSYWSDDAENNAPPDCSSPDASGESIGYGANGQPGTEHSCGECPWSQFGSATDKEGNPTAGQACKLVTNLVVLCDEAGRLPAIVPLPPTSGGAARTFRNQVFAKSVRRHDVVAKFALVEKAGAFKYSVADISIDAYLAPDQIEQVEAASALYLPAISRMFAARATR